MEISRNRVKLAMMFFERAKGDLKSAKDLLSAEDYADSVFHSQQCSEKIVKVILVLENTFVREHIVSEIFARTVLPKAGNRKEILIKIIDTLRDLEEHWVRPRYPLISELEVWNPLNEYKKEDAQNAIEKATFIFESLTTLLRDRYKIKDLNI